MTMPIQLIISGEHVTDLFAEIQNFANALNNSVAITVTTENVPQQRVNVENAVPYSEGPSAQEKVATPTGTVAEVKKTLNRKEQDQAETEMIENGEKDDRFEFLTKARQNNIEASLAKAAEPVTEEDDDIGGMFDDEDDAPVKTITREEVAELMAKVSKDENGDHIRTIALKVRAVLVDNIPDGEEIKVKNIPENKLQAVYDAVKKIGQ